jgi:hypothetical protein
VKPQLQEIQEAEDGTDRITALPVINGVPVVCLSGGGFGLEFPVTVGDTCLLIFSDRSIDKWAATGGDVDPEDLRRHHLSDAIAIVGLKHDNNKLSEYDTAAIQLGKQGGPRVRVTDTQVQLGGASGESPTESAVLGNTYRTSEDTLFDGIASNLNACSVQLGIAGTALTTAAADPVLAGLAPTAAGSLATAGGSLLSAVTSLAAVQGLVSAFKATATTYLSNIVKVK